MPENTFNIEDIQRGVEEVYIKMGGLSADKGRILSFLSPGIFIRTQLPNSFRWNVSTILDIKGDILTLPFTRDDSLSAVLVDDVLRFRFAVEMYDLNFICTVKDIEFSLFPTKLVKVLKAEIWKNKRGSTRHSVGFICDSISEMEEKFMSYLINISDSGGGVICKENLRLGSNIKLSFFGPDKTPLDLIATPVRSRRAGDNKMEYGIRFYDLRPDVRQKIQEIINMEKLQESVLFNDICKKHYLKPVI